MDTQSHDDEFDWNSGNIVTCPDQAGTKPEFLPGKTFFENDVTTDEEDEETTKEFGHLELFFHAIGEPGHIPLFEKHRVTLGQLLDFDENDLINCGIELVGDRKKILDSISQWHSEKWLPTSLNDVTGKKMLTAPGIYISLNDINKHLDYIGATFRYLKRVVQKKPEILELGKDYCGIRTIAKEIEDLRITHEKTGQYLKDLTREISKRVNDPLLLPPNEIDEYYVMRAKYGRKCFSLSILPIILLVGLGIVTKLSLFRSRT